MAFRTSMHVPLLVIGTTLLHADPVAARIIRVDATSTCGPPATCLGELADWNDAVPSLSAALLLAEADDQVWVAAGTYFPDPTGLTDPRDATFIIPSQVEVFGQFRRVGRTRPTTAGHTNGFDVL